MSSESQMDDQCTQAECTAEATHINTMHDGSETHGFCEVHAIQHFQLYAQRKIPVKMARLAASPEAARLLAGDMAREMYREPTAGESTQ